MARTCTSPCRGIENLGPLLLWHGAQQQIPLTAAPKP